MSHLSPPGGDQRIGGRLVVISSVLIVPGTILVALRLYVRTRITRTLGLDDVFLMLSLVSIRIVIQQYLSIKFYSY